jgi:hypothetical protein
MQSLLAQNPLPSCNDKVFVGVSKCKGYAENLMIAQGKIEFLGCMTLPEYTELPGYEWPKLASCRHTYAFNQPHNWDCIAGEGTNTHCIDNENDVNECYIFTYCEAPLGEVYDWFKYYSNMCEPIGIYIRHENMKKYIRCQGRTIGPIHTASNKQ